MSVDSPALPDRLSDFDYHLPEELIAQYPSPERSHSRLLAVPSPSEHVPGVLAPGGPNQAEAARSEADEPSIPARQQGLRFTDHRFTDLPSLLSPGDLLVVNDTRVINARLIGRRDTGGRVEVLVDRLLGKDEALCLVRASHTPRPGSRLYFEAVGDRACATVTVHVSESVEGSGSDRTLGTPRLRLRFDRPLLPLLEHAGRLPLPPYINHSPNANDRERYQTVYARSPGAVAAPTAGLHFDAAVFEALSRRGIEVASVTLHVGAGTFLPVRTERLEAHRMHAESWRIGAEAAAAIAATRNRGGRIIAVGTTTLRTLEASGGQAGDGETDLFIRPGYQFRVVDRLLTNLHLPRSTLLILVSAFAGVETIRAAYAYAIAARYRFFSYGDAMLLDCAGTNLSTGTNPMPKAPPR